MLRFNPRPPRGGRLFQLVDLPLGIVSIHAPRVGGDLRVSVRKTVRLCFNPRPPRGGRRANAPPVTFALTGFNPRPPRGGDPVHQFWWGHRAEFQSTPPAWGATYSTLHRPPLPLFQSTPPAWGRPHMAPDSALPNSFNPRPPRGGRRHQGAERHAVHSVSIHAPRVGGDGGRAAKQLGGFMFQSTPPAWGATAHGITDSMR